MADKVKRQRGTTRVSRKNQVTLPVAVLAGARVEPGDVLTVDATADGVVTLRRVTDPLADVLGSMPGLSATTELERLRDEWHR